MMDPILIRLFPPEINTLISPSPTGRILLTWSKAMIGQGGQLALLSRPPFFLLSFKNALEAGQASLLCIQGFPPTLSPDPQIFRLPEPEFFFSECCVRLAPAWLRVYLFECRKFPFFGPYCGRSRDLFLIFCPTTPKVDLQPAKRSKSTFLLQTPFFPFLHLDSKPSIPVTIVFSYPTAPGMFFPFLILPPAGDISGTFVDSPPPTPNARSRSVPH